MQRTARSVLNRENNQEKIIAKDIEVTQKVAIFVREGKNS